MNQEHIKTTDIQKIVHLFRWAGNACFECTVTACFSSTSKTFWHALTFFRLYNATFLWREFKLAQGSQRDIHTIEQKHRDGTECDRSLFTIHFYRLHVRCFPRWDEERNKVKWSVTFSICIVWCRWVWRCVCVCVRSRRVAVRWLEEWAKLLDYLYGRRKAETLLWMRRMKERGSISVESRGEYL